MKLYNFNKMKGGWYIGNFSPTVMKTSKLEVSYKVHKKNEKWPFHYHKKAIEIMHPIPKIGVGDDFAELGSYLLSENNKWITGQIMHIDGGRSTLRIKS